MEFVNKLEKEVEQYLDLAVVKKQSMQLSTESNHQGEIDFNWDIASNKILFGKTLRLNGELICSFGDVVANQPVVKNFKFSPLEIAGVNSKICAYIQDLENSYNKLIIYLNEQVLYSIDNYNYAEKLLKLCFDLPTYENKHINSDNLQATDVTVVINESNQFKKPKITDLKEDALSHIIRNGLAQGLDNKIRIPLSAKLDIPFFEKFSKTYGSANLKFAFFVDPLWKNRIAPCIKHTNANAPVTPVAGNAAPFNTFTLVKAPTANVIPTESAVVNALRVSMQNLYMTATMATTAARMYVSPKNSVLYDNYTCTIDTITGSNNNVVRTFLNVEPSIEKVMISYIYDGVAADSLINGGIFYGLTQPPVKSIKIKYGEMSYPPNDDFVFNFNNNADNSYRDNQMLFELYKQSFYKSNETTPKYLDWVYNGHPFVFNIKAPLMTRSNQLEIYTTLSDNVDSTKPMRIVVISCYKNLMSYEYDNGQLKIDSISNAV
jgi:hypothetical protein